MSARLSGKLARRSVPLPVSFCAIIWTAGLIVNYAVRVIAPDWAPFSLISDALRLIEISKDASFPAMSHIWAMILGGGLFLAGTAFGAIALIWLVPRIQRERAMILLAAALGLGLLGTLAYGLGFLGLLRRPVLAASLVLPAAGLLFPFSFPRRINFPSITPLTDSGNRWFLFFAAIAIAGYALSSLAPEIEMDSLKYHLGKTQQYMLSGRIAVNMSIFHKFPSLWEALIAIPFGLGGEPAAKFVQPLVVALTGALLFVLTNEAFPGAGIIASALYLTSYGTGRLAITAKNDLFVALLAFAAFGFWILRRKARGFAWLRPAGLCLGMALSTKFTALISLLVIPGLAIACNPSRRLSAAVPAILGWAALGYAPWGLKDYFETANPIYPFLSGVFGSGLSSASERLLDIETHRYIAASYESLADKVRAVWNVAVIERHWLIPALAVPASLIQLNRTTKAFPWALGSVVGFVIWTIGPPQSRFLVQVMPLMCGAIGLSAAAWGKNLMRAGAFQITALLIIGLEAVHGWGDYWSDRGARLAVAVGLLDSQVYHHEKLTTYSRAVDWAGKNLPENAHVLIFGPTRTYPLARRSTLRTDYEPLPPLVLAQQSKDIAHLERKMRQKGFTHVFYDRLNAVAWAEQMATLLPDIYSMERWASYWRGHANLIYHSPVFDLRQGIIAIYEFGPVPGPGAMQILPGIEAWFHLPESLMRRGRIREAYEAFEPVKKIAWDFAIVRQAYVAIFESILPRAESEEILSGVLDSGLKSIWLFTTLARYAEESGKKERAQRYRDMGSALTYRQEAWQQ